MDGQELLEKSWAMMEEESMRQQMELQQLQTSSIGPGSMYGQQAMDVPSMIDPATGQRIPIDPHFSSVQTIPNTDNNNSYLYGNAPTGVGGVSSGTTWEESTLNFISK
jgi:hypothetical protein